MYLGNRNVPSLPYHFPNDVTVARRSRKHNECHNDSHDLRKRWHLSPPLSSELTAPVGVNTPSGHAGPLGSFSTPVAAMVQLHRDLVDPEVRRRAWRFSSPSDSSPSDQPQPCCQRPDSETGSCRRPARAPSRHALRPRAVVPKFSNKYCITALSNRFT